MVCGGQTSRIEVAKELISILNLDSKVKISEVDSSYFKKEYYAERPASERLVNKKLDLRNLNLMRDWKIALKVYIETNYQDLIHE
jgi:dTDP-4-dehydrorhamnose reductase